MGQVFEMQNAPSAAEYVRALTILAPKVTDVQRRLFRVHYQAPDRVARAKQIAEWGDVGHWGTVNLSYTNLAKAVCKLLGIKPDLRPNDVYRWWSVWSRGWTAQGGFVWQMLPQVATALEELGWVGPPADSALPSMDVDNTLLVEGVASWNWAKTYERNAEARRRCVAVHLARCFICGFDFGANYGLEFAGYIHVHHLKPLHETSREHFVDPVKDLRPVCPNCHAVIHHDDRLRSLDEVRQLITRQR